MKTGSLFYLALALAAVAAGCRRKPPVNPEALHRAAEAGNLKWAQSLIAGGFDVNAKDLNEWTPLHWAAHGGHTETAKLLIA